MNTRHNNVAIFVPHEGCPNTCSFCNQRSISGQSDLPRGEDVRQICQKAYYEIEDKSSSEIAFFGGSFTAIKREYMLELLEAAYEFISCENGFLGIRISTRPDCIDGEILGILKQYGVTAIELGAQSMCDEVLYANRRGHDSKCVEIASQLIREYGFELGLQMMVGLYKSTYEDELATLDKICKIKPDTVRIYPVAIINGTHLGELYKSGEYKLMSMDTVIKLCANMLIRFQNEGIRVIKLGLHASETVEDELVAGYYHPAFRELVESRIIRDCIERHMPFEMNSIEAHVNPCGISAAIGHKKCNNEYFKNKDIDLKIKGNDKLSRNEISIAGVVYNVFEIT